MNRIFFSLFLFYISITDAFFFHLPQFNFKEVKTIGITERIDKIDDTLYDLMYERIELSKELRTCNSTIPDPCRQIYSLSRLRKKKMLDNTLVKSVWSLLYRESYLNNEDPSKELYHLNETMEEGKSEIL
jgi:chorismate mutase